MEQLLKQHKITFTDPINLCPAYSAEHVLTFANQGQERLMAHSSDAQRPKAGSATVQEVKKRNHKNRETNTFSCDQTMYITT